MFHFLSIIIVRVPYPTVHSNADTFQIVAGSDPTIHFPDLGRMLQNDPLRLPPFHFDADPNPAFHLMQNLLQVLRM